MPRETVVESCSHYYTSLTFQLHGSSSVDGLPSVPTTRGFDSPSRNFKLPTNIFSASSKVSGVPRKVVIGSGSGYTGIVAVFPMQLFFCKMHMANFSKAAVSCDVMQRYEHTWSFPLHLFKQSRACVWRKYY